MTWDIFLFNYENGPPDLVVFSGEKFSSSIMGSKVEIRKKIEKVWKNIDWGRNSYYEDENCIIKVYIFTQEGDYVPCIRLSPGYSRRNGKILNPYKALTELCITYGWEAYDNETGKFLEFPNPDESGLDVVRKRAASTLRQIRKVYRKL